MAESHVLKTWPASFTSIISGEKRAELRRDDRGGFVAGDTLVLCEYDPRTGYTGRSLKVRVTHVAVGEEWPIPDGYALLSIEEVRGGE